MFIINPYRYAATGPQPITAFYGSFYTASVFYTMGPVFDIISGSFYTSSVDFTIGAVGNVFSSSYIIVDTAEFSVGPSQETYLIAETITDTVEIIVT